MYLIILLQKKIHLFGINNETINTIYDDYKYDSILEVLDLFKGVRGDSFASEVNNFIKGYFVNEVYYISHDELSEKKEYKDYLDICINRDKREDIKLIKKKSKETSSVRSAVQIYEYKNHLFARISKVRSMSMDYQVGYIFDINFKL